MKQLNRFFKAPVLLVVAIFAFSSSAMGQPFSQYYTGALVYAMPILLNRASNKYEPTAQHRDRLPMAR